MNQDNIDKNIQTDDNDKERMITELSQKGYQLLKQGFIPESQTYFKKILDLDSTNNYALVGLGDSFRKSRRFRDAVSSYETCLKHYPNNNYALFGLADSHSALQHYHESARIWDRYLEHDHRNLSVLTRAADAHRKAHNYHRAKEIYEIALNSEPENLYALIGMGHLHYDFKEYDMALKHWLKVLEITEPRADIRILTSIGNSYRKLRRFQEALPYFERARQKDNRNFYALFGLADCFRGLNQPEQCLEIWQLLLKKEPDNKIILARAGDAYRKLDRDAEAERYYRAALEIEFDIYAALGLAQLNLKRGNSEDAIESLDSLIKRDPHNYRLYLALSEAYLQTRNESAARQTLESFLKQGLRHPAITEALTELTHK